MHPAPSHLRKFVLALAIVTMPATAAWSDDHDHDHDHSDRRGLGAHVHGVAELNVIVDADSLLVELNSPAANLVGFEHAPRDAAQRSTLVAARKTLENGAALFQPNPEADCVQISQMVELQLEDDAGSEHEMDHGHADAHGEWAFTCAKPASLSQLGVKLFEAFPGTERLRVQLVTSAGQRGAELTADRSELDL